MAELNIDGHRLVALGANEDYPGTPVIFMHGIMASIHFWAADKMPFFDRQFRYYSLSLPGHYPAAFPPAFQPADLTAEFMARVLGAAVRQLVGDEPALLIGHSTGGFAALNIAAHRTASVRAVVSVSGFAHGKWSGSLNLLQRLARIGPLGAALFKLNLNVGQASETIYRTITRTYAADRTALMHYEGIDSLLRQSYSTYRHIDKNAMLAYFQRMPDIDITPLLPRIDVPVLALAGDRDPIVPPAQAVQIAQKVQHGELVLLPGAGHIPMAERAEAYNQAVNGWVQAVVSPAGTAH